MNERIKELAEQAGLYDHDGMVLGYTSGYQGVSKEELQNFAEQIVRECADVPTLMWGTNEVNADVAVKIRNRILDIFGIDDDE